FSVGDETSSFLTSASSGASFSKPGSSSRMERGSSSAPERQCWPSSRAFSSTQMLSLESWNSGFRELCWSMSCDKRRAQASPAGPPPMMTTSASMCGRSMPERGVRKVIIREEVSRFHVSSFTWPTGQVARFHVSSFTGRSQLDRFQSFVLLPCEQVPTQPASNVKTLSFCLLNLLHQRWNNVEQISDHAVIRHLKDGRLRVLINSDHRSRAFHADNMLDRATDAESQVELRRNRLARRPDLAVHRQPAGVADRPRGRDLSAQGFRKLLGQLNVLLLLDAAADRHDDLRLRKIHRLLGFLEGRLRTRTDGAVRDLQVDCLDRRSSGTRLRFVAAERACLKGGKPGRITGEADVRRKLALKHLPLEEQLVAVLTIPGAVTDQCAPECGGELRGEIAHLVGVGHHHQTRLDARDELLQRGDKAVRGVRREVRRLQRVHLGEFLARELLCDIADIAARYRGFERPAGIGRDGLCGGNRLKRNPVQLAFPLLCDSENRI